MTDRMRKEARLLAIALTALAVMFVMTGCTTRHDLERHDGQPFVLYPVPEGWEK